MKKISLHKLSDFFKKFFRTYPLTMIITYLLTLFSIFMIDISSDLDSILIGQIYIFNAIFLVQTFFIESVFDKTSNKTLIISYIVSAIISALFTFFLNYLDVPADSSQLYLFYLARILIAYLLCLFVFTIYKLYKKSDLEFPEYLCNVFINFFKNTIIYLLLAFGGSIIYIILELLIFDGAFYDDNNFGKYQILLLGFFYVPKLLSSFSQIDEIGKFFKLVIKNILGVLVLIAFAIIYSYIVKIIFITEVPSNQVFPIISGLFIIGGPIWIMTMAFKENDKLEKVYTKLPYLFIPFVILQIYVLTLRISQYGITYSRYAGMILILFEIFYLLNYIFAKKNIKYTFFSLIGLILIALIVPVLNFETVTVRSQKERFDLFFQKNNLTDEESSSVYEAYKYLNDTPTGEKYLNEKLSSSQKIKIESFKHSNSSYTYNYTNPDPTKSLYGNKRITDLDISNYNKISYFKSSDYQHDSILSIFKKFDLKNEEGKIIGTYNISKYIKALIVYQENQETEYLNSFNDYFKEHNEIQIDENTAIVITSFSLTYYEKNHTLSHYSIEGFLLEK